LPEQTYVFAKILSLQRFLPKPEQLGTLFLASRSGARRLRRLSSSGGYRRRNSVSN
jgi:hypothetical protein